MKFSCKFSLICVFFLFFSLRGTTQINSLNVKDLSSVHINEIPDDEIRTYYKKAVESGISEQNMYRLLLEKGLPQSEITDLEKRLTRMSLKASDTDGDGRSGEPTATDPTLKSRYPNSEANIVPSQVNKGDSTIFGSELFTTSSLVFEPNLRIATPSNYILGPDDELAVVVYGLSEKSYNLTVNEEGYIYIPNVGPMYVNGLSIEEAGEKIKAKLGSTVYRAINSGQTKVTISLRKIRSIRVTVIGAAKRPGTFTVSSLTTLFNLLYLCGGPNDMGSYRTIELIRGNDPKRVADLYTFLLEGSKKDDILLREGDVIRIPYYKTRVTISGKVKRAGKFEMLETEMFNDLLRFAGDLSDDAYRASISLTRITDKEKILIDLDPGQFNNFKPKGSDAFFVGMLNDRFENRIYITGAVFRPGPYELRPGITLHDLLGKGGGIKEDAYRQRVNIYRKKNDLTPSMVTINLDSVLRQQTDLVLVKDDSVVVHSIFDFRGNLIVEIKGQVKKPGQFEWRENLTLRDVLLAAGGTNDFGDSARIEISRRLRNTDDSKINYDETKIFIIDLLNENNPSGDIILRPYDLVIVKKLPGYSSQRAVFVQGEVMSPGLYTLNKSGDRLSDVFKRTGGFKASADSSYVTLRRNTQNNLSGVEREKIFQRILNNDSIVLNSGVQNDIYKAYDVISVDLAKALSFPESGDNLRLEDGDVITIRRNSNLVKISGKVYYPTKIPFKPGVGLNYYIGMAGNFMDNARKSKAVVIYPDGRLKSVSRFLFIKRNPSVVAGSEIYVPEKSRVNKNKPSIGELALVISALGIIANVIIYAGK